jgi:hypothetical protein
MACPLAGTMRHRRIVCFRLAPALATFVPPAQHKERKGFLDKNSRSSLLEHPQ